MIDWLPGAGCPANIISSYEDDKAKKVLVTNYNTKLGFVFSLSPSPSIIPSKQTFASERASFIKLLTPEAIVRGTDAKTKVNITS